MTVHWVHDDNFKSVVELVAELAAYQITDDDWNAIRFGLKETNVDADHWYDYQFHGKRRVDLWVGLDDGGDINFGYRADPDLEAEIQTVLFVAERYFLSKEFPRPR